MNAAVEVVERKGLGHPDTLADGIAELASIRYSGYCLKHFGAVLHHNLDKVAVLGGRAVFGANDGHYDRPVRIICGGRASFCFAGEPVPVRDILTAAARDVLRAALPGYDRITWVIRHETTDSSKHPYWFAPRGLHDLPEHHQPRSNDTAYLVGAAPHTQAELCALAVESFFAAKPWTGSDIKVLVVRDGITFTATACVPALAGTVATAGEFADLTQDATAEVGAAIAQRLDSPFTLTCNTAGNTRFEPLSAQYLTVSGSAIDYGEDGLVGRGNARGGLISPGHGAGNEALFGKNPAYHVGKVGGWLADQAAAAAAAAFGPARVAVTWQNGSPYDSPWSISGCADLTDVATATATARRALARTDWCEDLVAAQRYLPRIGPVANLLDDLAAAQPR